MRPCPGNPRSRRRPTAIVLLAATCLLPRCTPGPSAEPELPDIGKFRSRIPPEPPTDANETGPTVRLRVTELLLPLQPPTGAAWALARQRGVEPPMAPLWSQNGLNACIVHRDVLEDFFAAIPEPKRIGQRRMLASRRPIALSPSARDRVRQSRRVTLTMPDGTVRKLTLRKGNCRLLVQAQPQPDGALLVHLTPQHFRPRTTIRPRSRLEKQLDGRVFDEFRLQARLAPDHVLLVGLVQATPPVPVDPPAVDAAPTSAPASAPADQPADESEPPAEEAAPVPPPPPQPQHLGQLILGPQPWRRDKHMFLAIVRDPEQ